MNAAPFGAGPTPSVQFDDESIQSGGSKLKMWGYIAIAVLVVALGAGALYYTSRPNPPEYKVGSCVQESGGKAAEVSCSESGAFRIVSRVSDHAQCPDPAQPYATLSSGGNSVLCLKKH